MFYPVPICPTSQTSTLSPLIEIFQAEPAGPIRGRETVSILSFLSPSLSTAAQGPAHEQTVPVNFY